MTDNEFLLFDRIEKIKSIVRQYGEDNFALSFSGGKDSTVLSDLVDRAIPGNTIPRLYANTGIELNMIRDFVKQKADKDTRIHIIPPTVPIQTMLKEEGYPFKSKKHARTVGLYQRKGKTKGVRAYLDEEPTVQWKGENLCPKILRYHFTNDFTLKVSDACCLKLKEEPIINWQKEHGKTFSIIGLMRQEGGRRKNAQCLKFKDKKLQAFQPLVAASKEWEDWYIETFKVDICDIYKPPYNFLRTGCKGCPFALHLQKELETLEKFFPAERRQCEEIWEPVYSEYRRIGYRLKPTCACRQMELDEFLKGDEDNC